MRGKVTFRDGLHHSRTGGWIEPVSIGNGEWRELESALGSLDVSARNNIEEYCGLLRSIWQEARVSAADVRLTLDRIANERDDSIVIQAFKDCDDTTEVMLDLFLYRLDGPDFFKLLPTLPPKRQAAKLRAAACLASKEYNPPRGPTMQGWQRLAAEYAIQLAKWRGLTTTAHAFADDEPEPIISLLQTLLGIIDHDDSAQSVSWCVKLIGEINARHA